jgi:molecular chaperone DnaK (HSP70)
MMIDMGGGTTDFAFLELSGKPKEPPVSQPVDPALKAEPWGNGRRSYGGRDLDALLLDHFLEQWGTSPGADYTQLLRETRRFKERFSANINDGVDIYQSIWLVGGQQKVVQLDRETFERITADYRSYFPRLVQAALEMAGVAADDISAIILTGGHSRWYFVEEALRHEFPHIGREDCTLLRHNHPEQSVARGLCYQRMILANSGETKLVRRKATHSIWVGIAPQERALETAIMASTLTGNMDTINYEPVLVMPEGQLLPFRPSAPVTLALQRLTLDNRSPVIGLRLYSGVQGGASISLLERTARFNRGVLEAMLKRMARRLPWTTGADEDRFLIDVFCHVDENEIISGKVVITRYWREKVMAIQTQPLRVDSARQAVALEQAIARTRISVSV